MSIAKITRKASGHVKGHPVRFCVGHARRIPVGKWYRKNAQRGLCECGCGRSAPIAPKTDRREGSVKGQPKHFVRGHSNRGSRHGMFRHGMSQTPEHEAYRQARSRCHNVKHPGWKNYGGRGIKFLFTSFEQFFAELGPRPRGRSLDRKNNDGHYKPGNVRWATGRQQQLNTRDKWANRRKSA